MDPAARVAVYGETLVDAFASGPVAGGAPFNVARHLAALGVPPLLLTAIGDDDRGQLVAREFGRFGLRREGLQVLHGRRTGVVDVLQAADGTHAFRIGDDCAWDHIGDAAAAALKRHGAPGGWLYHGSLALRGDVSRHTWRQAMALHAGPVFMDLNWREGQVGQSVAAEALAEADVLKVNDDELAMLAAWLSAPAPAWDGPDDVAVAAIARHFDLRQVIVTRGPRGAAAFDAQGRRIAEARAEALPALVDTVGAGDAFSAVVLAGLVGGWPLDAALSRASAFATRVCGIRGAVPQDLSWYAPTLAAWRA